ncbi:MAG: hypothetical protein ACLFVT_09345 [Syntrophobacteria bacterium]
MEGFAAITGANGWLIALLGVCVVFSGLASLALLISLFPRALYWWNTRSDRSVVGRLAGVFKRQRRRVPSANAPPTETLEAADLDDTEAALRMLTSRLGEPFKLPRLLELAEHRGLARPHAAINRLLLKGTITGGPDGLFRWANRADGKGPSHPGKGVPQ